MKFIIFVAVALVALDCVAAVSDNVPLDSLDSAFLSELKYNLRDETAPNRCGKFLSGIQDKLMDSSYGADLLKLVSKMLWNRGSANLAKFTDECFNILQGASTQPGPLPVTKVTLPSPAASNELIVKQLLNEQQALKERLREAVEENNALRSKLDITSIKLIKANYLRLDAEKDLASCKSKLKFGLNLHLHHSVE